MLQVIRADRVNGQESVIFSDEATSSDGLNGTVKKPLAYSSMSEFLNTIEKPAFHFTRISTSSIDDAHDLVQDSMYKLVEKYSDKSPQDWRPLFYRILNRKIIDHYRRKTIREKIFRQPSSTDSIKVDYWQSELYSGVADPNKEPSTLLERQERINCLTKSTAKLPIRQRQAFMLRYWEGLTTQETAHAMGCSQGSVKTHLSRAKTALQAILRTHYG
ncbi:MAG: RNA polymerase sigma factor [Porticoccaceae bacterium]|nr:RNA polymerase sigma factor [Porticoccaceae bacterium]